MSLAAWLYWFNVISNLQDIIVIALLALATIFGIGLIPVMGDYDGSYVNGYFKYLKKAKHALWLVLLLIFLPGKQTMYLMAGATYMERSDIPPKVHEALSLKLDDVIQQLKESKKK